MVKDGSLGQGDGEVELVSMGKNTGKHQALEVSRTTANTLVLGKDSAPGS